MALEDDGGPDVPRPLWPPRPGEGGAREEGREEEYGLETAPGQELEDGGG